MPAPAVDVLPLRVDVLIRGAGPVGCALALALRPSGLRVALADAAVPPPAFRPIALSYASRLILERLGAWADLSVTPIERIVVSQAGPLGRTRVDAAEAGGPAPCHRTRHSPPLVRLQARLPRHPGLA